jgi:uncharacterized tellurite resistance protein B-like protein
MRIGQLTDWPITPGSRTMGLLKRLFGRQEPSKPEMHPWDLLERPGSPESPDRRTAPAAPQPASTWVPAGHVATIQGFDLMDGMIYIGSGAAHPSLIDPALPIDLDASDVRGQGLEYWPSYHTIPPATRTAYLDWLSTGRRRPGANIGFVFLFFYGLERRVLVDIARDPALASELEPIRGEIRGLLDVYGPESGSFLTYASGLLDYIDFRRLQDDPSLPMPAPSLTANRLPASPLLRAEIGRIVAGGRRLPADRAFAWAWYLPDNTPRTPAIRCTREFIHLFIQRYDEQYPNGLPVPPAKSNVSVEYNPASRDLGTVSLRHPTIPDAFGLAAPGSRLRRLFDEVTAELDAYSRWIGRNPDAAHTLAAAAMLPRELLQQSTGNVRKLQQWATHILGTRSAAPASAAHLIDLWSPQGRLSKAEATQLTQLLSHMNIGIEPDVRFGGPVFSADDTIIVFRLEPDAPATTSPEYAAAANLMHLAAAVSKADNEISAEEIEHLMHHLEHALHLGAPERTRLHAHLRWLSRTDLKLTGLRKRFASMPLNVRTAMGDLLVTVATADGVVSPGEVTTLSRIYDILGLDPSTVTSRLHGAITSTKPASGPVTVRPATTPEPGYPIPPRPTAVEVPSFSLDSAQIQAKLADTAAVSALLSGIFADEEPAAPPPRPVSPPKSVSTAAPVAGLDAAHSTLFHAIVARTSWPRSEFEALTSKLALMPSGAIDTLNEASYDLAGEPILEGDDPLTVNTYALEELRP